METATPVTRAPMAVDLRPIRVAGAAMLGIAAASAVVPIRSVPYQCPLRAVTGIPCPFCGMTRGVIEVVHGNFVEAFLHNPGAFMVVALAIALLVAWRVQRVQVPVWTVFAFFTVLWTFQLWKYATDRPL